MILEVTIALCGAAAAGFTLGLCYAEVGRRRRQSGAAVQQSLVKLDTLGISVDALRAQLAALAEYQRSQWDTIHRLVLERNTSKEAATCTATQPRS